MKKLTTFFKQLVCWHDYVPVNNKKIGKETVITEDWQDFHQTKYKAWYVEVKCLHCGHITYKRKYSL